MKKDVGLGFAEQRIGRVELGHIAHFRGIVTLTEKRC